MKEIATAVSNEEARAALDTRLAGLEEKGWMLRDPAHRLWAGERDPAALTAGLDDQNSALVRRILELV